MSRLHYAATVPAQMKLPTEKARSRVSNAPCSLSSSRSLSRGAWPCNSNFRKVESNNTTRLSSAVAASASSASPNFGDEENNDGASSRMEWLSPTSGNPMEKWLQKGDERESDAWREECGVVAIFGDPEASRLCYLSLHALQHRGQEGAGIVTANEHTLHAVTGIYLFLVAPLLPLII